MNPERWQRLEQIYHAALEREPHEREVYLEDACRNDPGLRNEIESLIRHDNSSPDAPINASSWIFLDDSTPAVGKPIPGMRLGPYEIEQQIGAGGMGEVYKARDTRLNRSV